MPSEHTTMATIITIHTASTTLSLLLPPAALVSGARVTTKFSGVEVDDDVEDVDDVEEEVVDELDVEELDPVTTIVCARVISGTIATAARASGRMSLNMSIDE
mmetsp:Transcript_19910/g.51720  ORF Transcript_19910/g.51720 Transcript_19910/m.51720 type:complete len:103 (+) Transcript_19910:308-616(+)